MFPSFIEYVPKEQCQKDISIQGEYPSTQKEVEQHEEQGKVINVQYCHLFINKILWHRNP